MTSPDTRSVSAVSRTAPSALQLTRAAIARWRGAGAVAAQPKDVQRISPQARHLEQAQRGLTAWIAGGGFTQSTPAVVPALADEPPTAIRPPVRYSWATGAVRTDRTDACME